MFNTKYVMSKGLAFAEDEEMAMLSLYASEGWILYKFGLLGYKLKKGEPQNLQYSLDYMNNADEEYFSYFKQAGWNHVCSLGDTIHIFNAPQGTIPIYTDKNTEYEKYVGEYKSTKKIAIPSLLCSILCITLVIFAKNNYIPDICRVIFGVILIPVSIITIFSILPCISYYFKTNKLKEDCVPIKSYKIINKLLDNLSTILLVTIGLLLLLNKLNVLSISNSIFCLIWMIFIFILLLSSFIKV